MSSLDRAINNDFLTISKSLVPYLPSENQRSLAIFIKTFELMHTIDLFSRDDFVRSMSRSHETGWEKDFLHDVRQNLSGDRGYFIDALLKLTEVRDLFDSHNTTNANFVPPKPDVVDDISIVSPEPSPTPLEKSGPGLNPADIVDKLSNMLEPNQVQILKVLTSFMK